MTARISDTKIPDAPAAPRRGGRPSREQAGKIGDKILDAAAFLFFHEGYGATSIEEIARRARVSKRTFYARFDGKPDIFRAVVRRIVAHVRPADMDGVSNLFAGDDIDAVLRRVAQVILHGALSPEALALNRIIIAEASRFPELAMIVTEQGMRAEAISRIADALRHCHADARIDPVFAAEQFLLMLITAPQRRAYGLGVPMTKDEIAAWITNTVDLFLNGVR
ncbi:MAG: TetR/AcrR family transcriptional regulator [Alphaproteobacteria bacterium]|nr:TetR/AcrR family transcriptional regulator [Alphaproteobacteria bacterium]